MPVYSFACSNCGKSVDIVRPYTERETPAACDCGGRLEYYISSPRIKGEVKRGSSRLIWDERQVHADQGRDWRDQGTTRKEGGMGRTLYFDGGR